MALEARHHNHYPPQIITNNREFVKIDEATLNNPVQMACANAFDTTMENPWLGMNHQFMGMNNMIRPPTNFVKVENGFSDDLPNGPRKRSRDSMENQFSLNIPPITVDVPPGFAPQSNFPHDVQCLWDIDYILSQFNKDLKLQFQTQTERGVKLVLATITSKFVKKVHSQNEQICRLSILNRALQERVKSLSAEIQHWKDIAKSAELTNMSLRKDFEEILGKVAKLNTPTNAVAVEEDAESCYGSSDFGKNDEAVDQGTNKNKMCKTCGERESSVLVLPCRHLCLCGACGDSVQAKCPVCNSCMTATLHVFLT